MLTPSQIAAILLVLQVFGASTSTIAAVTQDLEGTSIPAVATSAVPTGSLPVFITPSNNIIDSNGNSVTLPQAQIEQPTIPATPGCPVGNNLAGCANATPSVGAAVVQAPALPTCTLAAIEQDHYNVNGQFTGWDIGFNWTYSPQDASSSIDGVGTPPSYTSNGGTTWRPGVFIPIPASTASYTMEVDTNTASTTCTSTISLSY